MGMGVGVISGMAYECDDNDVSSLPLVVRIFFQNAQPILAFDVEWFSVVAMSFINLFSEHLTPSIVNNAASTKTQAEVDNLFKKIKPPVKGGCDQIK